MAWRGMRFLAISCRQKGHVLPPLPLIEAQNGYHPTTFFLKITFLRIALKIGRRMSNRHQCAANKNKGD